MQEGNQEDSTRHQENHPIFQSEESLEIISNIIQEPPINYLKRILLIYFWLGWVFIAAGAFVQCGRAGVAPGCGADLSLQRLLVAEHELLPAQLRQVRFPGSGAQAHTWGAYSCSTPRGTLLDQGWELCLLHLRHVDSLLRSHQGSPVFSTERPF